MPTPVFLHLKPYFDVQHLIFLLISTCEESSLLIKNAKNDRINFLTMKATILDTHCRINRVLLAIQLKPKYCTQTVSNAIIRLLYYIVIAQSNTI